MVLRVAIVVLCIVNVIGMKAENLPSGWELVSTHRQWMQENCPKPEDLSEKELMLECARLINYTLREPEAKALIQSMADRIPEFSNYLAWLDSNTEDILMERHIAALSALSDYAVSTYGETSTIAGWCCWYELGFRTIIKAELSPWDQMIANQEKAAKKENTKEAKTLLCIMRLDKANLLQNYYLVDDPTYYSEIIKAEKEAITLYPQNGPETDLVKGILYLTMGQAFSTISNYDIMAEVAPNYMTDENTQYNLLADGNFSPALFYMNQGVKIIENTFNSGHPMTMQSNYTIDSYVLNNIIQREYLLEKKQQAIDFYRAYHPLNSLYYLLAIFDLWTLRDLYQQPNPDFYLWDYRLKELTKILGEDNPIILGNYIGLIYEAAYYQPDQVDNIIDLYDSFLNRNFQDNPLTLAVYKQIFKSFKDLRPERSLNYFNEAFDLYVKNHNGNPASLFLGYNGALNAFGAYHDYSQSAKWFECYIEDLSKIFGKDSQIVFENRLNLANTLCANDPQDLSGFLPLISDIEKVKKNPCKVYNDYATCLSNINRFDEAEKYYKRAIDSSAGMTPSFQAMLRFNLINLLEDQGKSSKDAEKLFQKACQLLQEESDTLLMNSYNYFLASNHLSHIGEYERALDFIDTGIKIYEYQGMGQIDQSYLTLLSTKNHIMFYNLNQQTAAIQLMMQEVEDLRNWGVEYYTTEFLDFLWSCFNLIKNNNSKDYIALYFLFQIKTYSESLQTTMGDSPEFLNNYAIPLICEIVNYMGWFSQEIDKGLIENLSINEETKTQYLSLYNSLMSAITEEFVKFENYQNEYLDNPSNALLSKSAFDQLSLTFGDFYRFISKDWTKAEYQYNLYVNNSTDELQSLNGLVPIFDYYFDNKELTKIKPIADIITRHIDDPSFAVQGKLNLATRICDFYKYSGQTDQQVLYANKCYELAREFLDLNFGTMSQKEQNNLMAAVGDPAYPFMELLNKAPESVSRDCYNALLYRTGLQLRSQQDTKKLLTRLDNPEIKLLQDSLNYLRTFDKQLSSAEENGATNQQKYNQKTKLSFDIVRLEQQLLQATEEYRHEQMPDITWSDVQGKLKDHEAAIEITFSEMYSTALIVRPGYGNPQVVQLCHFDSLSNALQSIGTKQPHRLAYRLYGDKSKVDLYSMLWKPMEPYLNGVNRIYLSVEGLLYYLSFPAIKVDSDTYLFDKYDICQLTTTAELVTGKPAKMPESALLLGAIYYSNAQQQLDPYAQWSETQDLALSNGEDQHRAIDDFDEAERGGNDHFVYLQNTPAELNNVSKAISAHATPATLLKDKADESSFKQALGQKPQLLHLATHGFFLPTENDAYKIPFFKRYASNLWSSMQRAGFALSHAEEAWCGAELDEANDGIMTADEIAQLDLADTQLVTISACESALGDYSYEGVFGLPRGFKQAGAKSLLVSLWSVSDASTSLLMSTFYREWMGGKPMRQAYREAMAEVRKKYPHPYYWASFQLLDALD